MSTEADPKNGLPKFAPGQVMATRNALNSIPPGEVICALFRHAGGDWGDLCEEDWRANEEALKTGGRLFSVYHTASEVKFYIITEWDRSVTTVLLPDDY